MLELLTHELSGDAKWIARPSLKGSDAIEERARIITKLRRDEVVWDWQGRQITAARIRARSPA